MNNLKTLITRLKKINIELETVGNIPWIYLRSVNGNVVDKEDWNANYGYTIAYWNGEAEIADLTKAFKIIRKYLKPNKK